MAVFFFLVFLTNFRRMIEEDEDGRRETGDGERKSARMESVSQPANETSLCRGIPSTDRVNVEK